jgi:hypothetical protein
MFPDGRMDVENAARYLGLKRKTLDMYRSAGIGPKFVKRGRVSYYREDLDEWLREGRVISTAQARQLSAAAGMAAKRFLSAVAQVPVTTPSRPRQRRSKSGAKRKPDRPK